jgi:phenylacetate-CoA ligase
MLIQVLKNWAWLQRTQWFSRDQLANIQTKRLREAVKHAYRTVPFYRRLYDSTRAIEDLTMNYQAFTQLPIVTKTDFRRTELKYRTANDVDTSVCMPLTTSGSTGTPIAILIDQYAAAFRDALNLRMLWSYGVRPFHRIFRSRGGLTERIELQERRAGEAGAWGFIKNRHYTLRLFSGNIQDDLEFLSDWKPATLIAAGSYCKALAMASQTYARPLKFKLVIATAEILSKTTREVIAEKFQAEVLDHYGIEEVGSIAWECPDHAGYHVNTDSILVEILQDGQPLPPGETGEIYITSFHQKATPIIRYPTGDIGTTLEDKCPCGRGLTLMSQLQGRVLHLIQTPEGNYVAPTAIVGAIEDVRGIERFKVIQQRDFSVEILLETNKEATKEVMSELERRCKILFGDLPISIKDVGRISDKGKSKFSVIESRLLDNQ